MPAVPWEIKPGVGIGPFQVDQEVNKVVSYLCKSGGFLNTPAKFAFDPADSYSSDIVISLPDSAVQLTFDGYTQRITDICVCPQAGDSFPQNPLWTSYVLTYSGHTVHSTTDPADCRRIMSIFPPTTLGQFTYKELSYTVHFTIGVSFKFRIKTKAIFEQLASRRDHPVLVDGYSPLLSEIRIHGKPMSESEKLSSLPRFEIYPNEGVSLKVPGQDSSVFIRLGSGPQDVISAIGFPGDTWNGIYNYFQYGLDVITSAEKMHVVTGIIVHTNPPGHVQFGRYTRSGFNVSTGKKKAKEILNNGSSIPEFEAAFGDPGQPLVVSNTSPENIQYMYTFPNSMCIETTPDGIIASVQISVLNI